MREGERHVNIIEPLVTLSFPLFYECYRSLEIQRDRRSETTDEIFCRRAFRTVSVPEVARRDNSPLVLFDHLPLCIFTCVSGIYSAKSQYKSFIIR